MNSRYRLVALSVLLFVGLSFSHSAYAADYYVSPSGSDSNPGSQSLPWQTIGKVNTVNFLAGDRILFQGGQTFSGKIYFESTDTGTAANPIVVTSYGIGRATISGGSTGAFYAYNTAGIDIENINFVGSGASTNTESGVAVYTDLPGNVKLDTIKINNSDISGFGKDGIDIGAWNGLTGFKNVTITNVSVHDNLLGGLSTYGYTPHVGGFPNQNFYIGHSTFYNNTGKAGVSSPTGSGVVLGEVDGAVIERSLAYNNGINNTNSAGPCGIWTYDSNNVTIQYNEAHHNHTGNTNDGDGFDFDGAVTNSVMQYNYSHDNDGVGFLVAQYGGAPAINSNNTIRYNISQNNSRKNPTGEIAFWNGTTTSGISGTQVYNNTLYISGAVTYSNAISLWSPVTNVHLRNNIVVVSAGANAVSVVPGQSNVSFDGNDYWASGGGTTTFAYANAAHSGELSVDPGLVGVGTGGTLNNPDLLSSLTMYKLLSTSKLIDKGLNLSTVYGVTPGPLDYFGTTIPQGAGFDIGASEFVGTTTPPPTLPVIGAFSVSSSTITSGQKAVLTWQTSGATSLSIDQNIGVVTSLTSYTVSPTQTTTYTLTATNSAGSVSSQITVTVTALPPLKVGITVKTTASVTVRRQASVTSKAMGTQPAGATGKIMSGPIVSGGYTWWNINFTTGADGWVAQNYLTSVLASNSVSPARSLATSALQDKIQTLELLVATISQQLAVLKQEMSAAVANAATQ